MFVASCKLSTESSPQALILLFTISACQREHTASISTGPVVVPVMCGFLVGGGGHIVQSVPPFSLYGCPSNCHCQEALLPGEGH